jgi:glycosyltransferase involved in cell wall biosynthesis
MKKFKYKNIFLYASLQFCGRIEEYFLQNTEKLVVHITLPRTQKRSNLYRFYYKGKLLEEKNFWMVHNIFLYYISWYIQYLYLFFRYFSRKEKFFLISFFPFPLVGMTFQRLVRRIEYVYWTPDYCPAKEIPIRIFEAMKKYYHDNVTYTAYLSDTINKILNGKVLKTNNKKTIMWGVNPIAIKRSIKKAQFTFLFIGVVKESQGLDFFFDFLRSRKDFRIKVLGVCDEKLYKRYKNLIRKYKIENRVFFPNKFFSDEDVKKISKTCHVGIALYDTDKSNMTYYTDPGKVKTYTELGLPVIMSDVSAVTTYIKKFKAGEIVERDSDSLSKALTNIKNNYTTYITGVKRFNNNFFYQKYYDKAFTFLR